MSRGRVVVVGAGLAGAHVAGTLRAEGYDGQVVLLGDEPEPPYERPPLSKDFLQGAAELTDALVHPAAWYAEHDVELRTETAVREIDRTASEVVLARGERLGFDRLVLATGSAPRTLDLPGAGLDGVGTLRTAADAQRLRAAIGEGARLVVVGGGWLGLEVAASARTRGAEVTVLEAGALPLGRVLGPRVAQHVVDLHRRHGVDVRTQVEVRELRGEAGRVRAVVTGSGLIAADVVLVAVGAEPRTSLAEVAGLRVDGGVVVDEYLRSSDAHVLAAGDVALARCTALGTALRVEHWDNAIRQGELAARTILGTGQTYDWLPFFFTDQFELGMEYVGSSGPDDDVVVRGDMAAGEFITFWLAQGRVTAAMHVQQWGTIDTLRGIVGRVVPPGRLTDTRIDLEEI